MANQKKKEKTSKSRIEINRREAGGKKKPDLFAKFRNNEHPLDGLIPSSDSVNDNNDPIRDYPTLPEVTLPQTTLDYPTLLQAENTKNSSDKELTEVSPTKNFTKFTNSILKQAIPDGLFKGQSKHTYDVLYQKTRGAIVPKREVQLTKIELVKLTGLEIKTIQRHLSHLRAVGLINVDPKIGDHKGAVYEVVVPEEMTLPEGTLVQSSVVEGSVVEPGVLYTREGGIKYTTLGLGNPVDNKGTYADPNTSLKTLRYIDDDAPIVSALERLNREARAATGKDLTKKDLEAFGELIEIIINETSIARARTKSISNYLKFASENLRRRLYSKPEKSIVKPKLFEPGKEETSDVPETEPSEVSPMSAEARENALVIFRSIVKESGIEAIENFRGLHTAEDFEWFIEKLK